MKKLLSLLLIPVSILLLSGCFLAGWIDGGCGFLDDDHDRSHCYQKIGIYGNSPETCEEATYGGTRTKCFIKLAMRQGDGSYCDYIGENEGPPNYSREQCYQAVAIETGNPEYCEKMGNYRAGFNDMSGGVSYNKENCLSAIGPIEEEEEELAEGECKYDSDCDPVCEGNTYWKMGCNGRTNMCEKTFDTNCSEEDTDIGAFSFPKLCSVASKCEDDGATIRQMKSALSEQAMAFQNLMQNVETARKQALDNCLSALSDVTNKFIIDSAITFSSLTGLRVDTSYQSMGNFSKYLQPSGSAVSSIATAQVTGPVQQLIDKLGSIAAQEVTGEKPKMPVEDYIALHCNASKTLKAEHDRLATERDKNIDLGKPFKGW